MDRARKYAQAFLSVCGDRVTDELIENIGKAAQFLASHRRAIFLLRVPVIDRAVKIQGIDEFCQRFSLGDSIKKLLTTLLDEHSSVRFITVLRQIVAQYRKKKSIVSVQVASSSKLSDEQRTIIEAFVDTHIAGTKQYEYVTDPSLIAGVRISTDNVLWEESVARTLRDLHYSAIW